jgi:hypothetical protein
MQIRIEVIKKIRIPLKVKIQELWKLKIEPLKIVDAHRRGVDRGSNFSREGSADQ